MTSTEQSGLQEELRALFERAKLPTSPAIAAQILQLIDDPESSAAQFTEVIQADPAIAGRLLKMANSARYAQRNAVTTIQRAVTVLGLRQLRVLVLGFELVSHLDRLGRAPFDLPSFWKVSVLRACVARELARKVVPSMADEAFLVGLLQDSGLVLLTQLLGREYGELCSSSLSPDEFYSEERRRFRHTHVEAVAELSAMWGLPVTIREPVGRHHERIAVGGSAPEEVRLVAVAYFVGSMPFTPEGTVAGDEPDLKTYATRELRLDAETLEECMTRAMEEFVPISELFGDALNADFDAADLLQDANRKLQEQAVDAAAQVREVEAERDQILDEQVTLRNALGQYRQQAARDPLTALLNRRALLDATVYCIRRSELSNTPITVLFMDLDDFKAVNDHYGHPVGDTVLQVLAETIRQVMEGSGFAGRYGGEEFVVVVPELSEAEARQFAERMLAGIRAAEIPGVPLQQQITCSIGAVWCEPRRAMSPEGLLGRADELMYLAKKGGKNRCCFRSLPRNDAAGPEDGGEEATSFPIQPDVEPGESSPERFRQVAETLNRAQKTWAASNRKQVRLNVCVPCSMSLFVGSNEKLRRDEAYVRNISSGGVGILAAAPLVRGDLVEVVLDVKGSPLYLAGVVAFSRKVEPGIFDIGLQLYQQSRDPIISRDGRPLQDLDWVVQVLGERPGVDAGARKSA